MTASVIVLTEHEQQRLQHWIDFDVESLLGEKCSTATTPADLTAANALVASYATMWRAVEAGAIPDGAAHSAAAVIRRFRHECREIREGNEYDLQQLRNGGEQYAQEQYRQPLAEISGKLEAGLNEDVADDALFNDLLRRLAGEFDQVAA